MRRTCSRYKGNFNLTVLRVLFIFHQYFHPTQPDDTDHDDNDAHVHEYSILSCCVLVISYRPPFLEFLTNLERWEIAIMTALSVRKEGWNHRTSVA